jgi:hypothetical protein
MQMLFCDKCGEEHKFEAVGQQRGECDICHQRIGTMNIMSSVYLNKLKETEGKICEVAGVRVRQIESIIPHQKLSTIHPDMIHKRLTTDKLVFMNNSKVIILNETTGHQVEIAL